VRSKIAANESSAVQNLRTITTDEVVYSTTYNIGYSSNLGKLGGNVLVADANNAGLIDDVLATGTKSGYKFAYVAGPPDGNGNISDYTLNADPVTPGQTGVRHFFTDHTSVIRQNSNAPAGPNDPPIS
jgi:hypothetical protein